MLTVVWAEAALQLRVLRRTPDRMLPLVVVPLLTAAILTITQNAGRADLAGTAVVGTAIIGIWGFAIYIAGDIIESERWLGTLEGVITTPAPFVVTLLARIATVTAVSFASIAESAFVADVFFGVHPAVHHKLLFTLTLACTWLAMTGTALTMSGLFVLTRAIGTYQNALTYPFYVLSGAVTPISLLPGWLHPLSRIVFLSWSADLLRACMTSGGVADPAKGIIAILVLGVAGAGIGLWSTSVILRRMYRLGTIGHL